MLKNLPPADLDLHRTDYLVVGSGIAGLYAALLLAEMGQVTVLAKEEIDLCSTALAQGGIAAAMGKMDSPEKHFSDTIAAGAGLCDPEAVRVMTYEGPEQIEALRGLGVDFDCRNGELSLTKEAAHQEFRVVHVKDTTGKAILEVLTARCREHKNIYLWEHQQALELLQNSEGHCRGAFVCDRGRKIYCIHAKAVILATGGAGQLYRFTSTPRINTGDGMVMAYRAGCKLADLEFMQFHPTVFYDQGCQDFLISEAVRGEGAVLLNKQGERFMPALHPLAELAPRDVVSRAIWKQMEIDGRPFVELDMRSIAGVKDRFPGISEHCLRSGIDPAKDLVPVAPAMHYTMGGIVTDLNGTTGVTGLYACGEVACTGVHGANRLASNSLLEGMVFARRVVRHLGSPKEQPISVDSIQSLMGRSILQMEHPAWQDMRKRLQKLMWDQVGIVRDAHGLTQAQQEIRVLQKEANELPENSLAGVEVTGMLELAELVVTAALKRQESRGAHYRSDYSQTMADPTPLQISFQIAPKKGVEKDDTI